jgi:agmatinase
VIKVGLMIGIPLKGQEDLENDREVGFALITADDIDDLGANQVVHRIRDRVGDMPVYLRCVSTYLHA